MYMDIILRKKIDDIQNRYRKAFEDMRALEKDFYLFCECVESCQEELNKSDEIENMVKKTNYSIEELKSLMYMWEGYTHMVTEEFEAIISAIHPAFKSPPIHL